MVSTIRYPKLKRSLFRRFPRWRLTLLLSFLVGLLLFAALYREGRYLPVSIFSLFALYIVVGLVSFSIHTIQRFRL